MDYHKLGYVTKLRKKKEKRKKKTVAPVAIQRTQMHHHIFLPSYLVNSQI
jgi:hypothetical protein